MPKMFVHMPSGAFSPDARGLIAAELTDLGMSCERLVDSAAIRSGVWVFFTEHGAETVFSGGLVVSHPMVALLVNAIKGGLDEHAKKRFITEATAILTKHCSSGTEPLPIYVAIQEIPEVNWGMYGKQVVLSSMQIAAP